MVFRHCQRMGALVDPVLVCDAALVVENMPARIAMQNFLYLLARLSLLPSTSVSRFPHHKSMSRIHTCLFSVVDSSEA